MNYRNAKKYASIKETIKSAILSDSLPDVTVIEKTIKDEKDILADLRKLQAFKDIALSETMITEALESLREEKKIEREDDPLTVAI